MATIADLTRWASQGESETLEFKTHVNAERLAETVCAFANAKGGKILLGIGELPTLSKSGSGPQNFSLVGVDRIAIEGAIASIDQFFEQSKPKYQTEHVEDRNGRHFYIINVEQSSEMVFLIDRRAFIREGNRTSQMTAPAREHRAISKFEIGEKEDVKVVKSSSAEASRRGEEEAPEPSSEEEGITQSAEGRVEEESSASASSRLGNSFTFRRDAGEGEQALNVAEYADALADLFESAKDDEQFCFGLFGHWGRGKTFLMNAVSERLQARGYKKVLFSAWKYRTTPEVWVHLYETVLAEARKGSWAYAVRGSLVRVGPWPAIGATASLFLALITFGQKMETLKLFVSLLGVTGLIYYSLLWLNIRSFASKIRSHYAGPANHAERLGLQAAIGLDMRSMLIGWMPRSWFSFQWEWATALPLLAYLFTASAVGWQIWESLPPAPNLAHISSLALWFGTTVVVPAVVFGGLLAPSVCCSLSMISIDAIQHKCLK